MKLILVEQVYYLKTCTTINYGRYLIDKVYVKTYDIKTYGTAREMSDNS